MRRHLVRKSAKAQVVHVGKEHREQSARPRRSDRQPHEVGCTGGGVPGGGPPRVVLRGTHRTAPPQVFVELNELVLDKNQELQWKETARWIKFEEDVEEETDRWGKPHVASLSFRSLLELRKTLSHGTARGRPPGVRAGGSPLSPLPPRRRAAGSGPEDVAWRGPPGGGADGHHRPDPG